MDDQPGEFSHSSFFFIKCWIYFFNLSPRYSCWDHVHVLSISSIHTIWVPRFNWLYFLFAYWTLSNTHIQIKIIKVWLINNFLSIRITFCITTNSFDTESITYSSILWTHTKLLCYYEIWSIYIHKQLWWLAYKK